MVRRRVESEPVTVEVQRNGTGISVETLASNGYDDEVAEPEQRSLFS